MKKFLSLFLTAMMVINIMPVGAFAGLTPVIAPETKTEEVTPEGTPTVTPEASPVVAPEASPVVAPEASPVVAPEASPVVTPEASPVVTPEASPAITPEASPVVVPEASPAVSPAARPDAGLSANTRDIKSNGFEEEFTIAVGESITIDSYSLFADWSIDDNRAVVRLSGSGRKATVTGLTKGVVFITSKTILRTKRYKVTVEAPEPERHKVNFFVRVIKELPSDLSQGGSAADYLPGGESHNINGTISQDVYDQLMNGVVTNPEGVFGNGANPDQMTVPSDLSLGGVDANQQVRWYLAKSHSATDIHIDGYIFGEAIAIDYVANFDGAVPTHETTDTFTGTPTTVGANIWTREGYTFLGWNENKAATVADGAYAVGTSFIPQTDVRLYAVWSKNPDPTATYTVKHLTENLDGEYTLVDTVVSSETVVGTKVTAAASSKVGTGFTAPETMPAGTVLKDGSLVLEVKYSRDSYKLNFVVNGNTTSHDFKFDAPVTATAPIVESDATVTFKGWDNEIPTNMPAENVIITANFAKKANAQVWFYSNKNADPVQNTAIAPDVNREEGDLLGLSVSDIVGYANAQIALRTDIKYKSFVIWNKVGNQDVLVYNSANGTQDTALIPLIAGDSTRIHITYEHAKKVTVNYFTLSQNGESTPYGQPSTIDNVFNGDTVTVNKGTAPAGYTFSHATLAGSTDILGDSYEYSAKGGIVNVYYGYDAEQWFNVSYNVNAPVGFVQSGEAPVDANNYLNTDATVLTENTLVVADVNGFKSHKFLGWSTDPTATEKEFAAGDTFTVAAATTLYAVWQINEYEISFKDEDGKAISTVKTSHGKMPVEPTAPSKAATAEYTYTFKGWDKTIVAATDKTEYKATYTATANIYNVNYKYNLPKDVLQADIDAGKTIAPQTTSHAFMTDVTAEEASELTGYNFLGWQIEADEVIRPTVNFSMPAEDVTLVGTWEAAKGVTPYKMTAYMENLDGSYRTESAQRKGAIGQEFKANTTAGKGFEYVTKDNSKTEAIVTADGTAETVVYFNRIQSEVKYITTNAPAGAPAAPATVKYRYNAPVTIEAPLSMPGYIFSGWKLQGDMQKVEAGFKMGIKDVTLVGSWTAREDLSYTVETYLQNIANDDYTMDKKVMVDGVFMGATAEVTPDKKDGFNFESGISTVKEVVNPNGKTTLKVYYSREIYQIQYGYVNQVPGAPEVPATVFAKFETPFTVAANPELAGYTFDGWRDNTVVTGPAIPTKMPMGGAEIAGSWTANTNTQYTVNYYYQNISGDEYTQAAAETQVLTDGTTDKAISTVAQAKTGFTFNPEKSVITSTVKGDGTTVLTVSYSRNSYPVNYYLDSATYSTSQVRFGATVNPLAAPTVAGRTFNGWSTVPKTMPAAAVNVYGSTTLIPAPVVPDEAVPAGPTPVAPVAPVTPPTVLPDPEVPEGPTPEVSPSPSPSASPVAPVVIPDDDIPQGPGIATSAWALVNLLLAVATAITSIVLLVGYYMGKKKNEEDGIVESEETLKRKGFYRLASLIPTIGAIVMFILTENILNPMVMTDKWTVMMLCIALVQVVVCFFCKKADKKEENEGGANA